MKSILINYLQQIIDQSQLQISYQHQLTQPEHLSSQQTHSGLILSNQIQSNQIHSQLLNYYGLNRFGTGRWFSISPTHFRVFHQTADYKLINEQRSYKIHLYTLRRQQQTEAFIQRLAMADAVFAQQIEQLGTVCDSVSEKEYHLYKLIETIAPDIFNQLGFTQTQKTKGKATTVPACFVRVQPGIFLGLGSEFDSITQNSAAHHSVTQAQSANIQLPQQTDPTRSGDHTLNTDHTHTTDHIHDHTHNLVVGFSHPFPVYANTVSERDLAEFFQGYAINSQPAFALRFPLLPAQYQLWKQLLPNWFYSRQKARFHFHNQTLGVDIISENPLHIIDKAIAFNYSLDRIDHQTAKHISKKQRVNSRISTLTWSDGSSEQNVYLSEQTTLTFPVTILEQFHTKHSLSTS